MRTTKYKNISEQLYEKTLKNGLTVCLIPKVGFKRTFACFGSKYGSLTNKFIPRGEKEYIEVPLGIAHFLEHKLFEMPDGTDASNLYAELGLEANAYTDYNQTVYLFSGTSNIEKGIELLLDFVQTPHFTDESVAKEQGIIDQELKMYLDMSQDRLHVGILDNMFKEYPLKYDIGGTVDSIKLITKELLYKCYDTFYHPSNMTFVVVGDFSPNEMMKIIEKNQNKKSFDKLEDIRKKYTLEDEQVNVVSSNIRMDITTPKVVVGLKLPFEKYKKNDAMMIELLLKVLLESHIGVSSDTYQELLDLELISEGLSYSVYVDQFCGYIKIAATSKKPAEFSKYVREKLKYLADAELNQEVFERFKKAILGSFLKSLNSLDFIATSILEYRFKNCDIFSSLQLLENTTLKDLESMKKYFVASALSDFTILPLE